MNRINYAVHHMKESLQTNSVIKSKKSFDKWITTTVVGWVLSFNRIRNGDSLKKKMLKNLVLLIVYGIIFTRKLEDKNIFYLLPRCVPKEPTLILSEVQLTILNECRMFRWQKFFSRNWLFIIHIGHRSSKYVNIHYLYKTYRYSNFQVSRNYDWCNSMCVYN